MKLDAENVIILRDFVVHIISVKAEQNWLQGWGDEHFGDSII